MSDRTAACQFVFPEERKCGFAPREHVHTPTPCERERRPLAGPLPNFPSDSERPSAERKAHLGHAGNRSDGPCRAHRLAAARVTRKEIA